MRCRGASRRRSDGPPGEMTNILFTSVGRRVELMRLFRASYRALSDDGHIVATDIDSLAPALHALGAGDKTYLVPRSSDESFVSRLLEICTKERIDLVLPLIDPDIPVLANEGQRFNEMGILAGSVNSRAAAITRDKWETVGFLRSLGIPVPETWLPSDLGPARTQLPVIVKPRAGSAAKDVVKVQTPDELEFFSRAVSNSIVQEFLPGPEITTDVVVDARGTVIAAVCRQRIAVRSGEVSKGVTIHDQEISRIAGQIATALGAFGPITVQCIFKDGKPYFTEINSRLGGGAPLTVAAGVDIPSIVLRSRRGEAVQPIEWNGYRADLYLTRYDDSFFLDAKHQRV